MFNRKIILIPLFLATLSLAKLRLPSIIGDNMMLQHQSAVAIWGWAEPYQRIDVKGSWMALAVGARADSNGRWQVRIKAPQAGGPFTMVVQSDNEFIQLTNIYSGEVWLCVGGINMDIPLKSTSDWEQEAAGADIGELRLFKVPQKIAESPQADIESLWQESSAKSSAEFSALAYHYGKTLNQSLSIPIGIVQASYADAPAEAWVKREALAGDVVLLPILERFRQKVLNYPAQMQSYNEALAIWQAQEEPDIKDKPVEPVLRDESSPGSLYNGMIAPLVPFKFKGVVFYQGESNVARGWQYRKLFPTLIQSWRNGWGNMNLPFYFVQLASFDYDDEGKNTLFDIRESQLYTLYSVLNTGMVVTSDLGEVDDIGSPDKKEVALRLAYWARARDYGNRGLVFSGPLYRGMEIEEGKIRILFEHLGQGLSTSDLKALRCFTIAGEDMQFHTAKAVIERNTVLVSSEAVGEPVAVRFAQNNTDKPNLINRQGLPATPFRTDNFPLPTENQR